MIADDILTGLGKRRDVAGVGRNAHADIALTITWLRAYDVTALVATEAQRLSPLVLKALVALARRATVPLCGCCTGHPAPTRSLQPRQAPGPPHAPR